MSSRSTRFPDSSTIFCSPHFSNHNPLTSRRLVQSLPLEMNPTPNTTSASEQSPCEQFARGKCKSGKGCLRDHHHKLDPARRNDKKEDFRDFDVPNDPNVACQRCTQQLREASLKSSNATVLTHSQCDKLNRGGNDDPCSECRQFGGPGCQCTLSSQLTYNTVVWDQMIARSASEYNLAQLESTTGKITSPMPDHEVKIGWVGDSKEALLKKPDFLPAHVRQLPRAYVVPPGIDISRREQDKRDETIAGLSRPDTSLPTRSQFSNFPNESQLPSQLSTTQSQAATNPPSPLLASQPPANSMQAHPAPETTKQPGGLSCRDWLPFTITSIEWITP
jgi:hypothetical protein